MVDAYREHECRRGHIYRAPVRLSAHTPNLSGEVYPACPVCGDRRQFSSAWMYRTGERIAFDSPDVDAKPSGKGDVIIIKGE